MISPTDLRPLPTTPRGPLLAGRRLRILPILALAFLVPAAGTPGRLQAQSEGDPRWIAGARVHTSVGTDTNVLETLGPLGLEEDGFLRILLEGELGTRSLPLRIRGTLNGRVLSESFVDHPIEDRIQGDLRAGFDLPGPGARGRSRIEIGGEARDYPDSTARDHQRGWVRGALGLPMGPRGWLLVRGDLWVLDFRRTRRQDQQGLGVDLSYEQPVRRGLWLQAGLELGSVDHGIPSIQVEHSTPELPGEPVFGPDRSDSYRFAHVGFRWLRRWLLRVQYGYRSQQSNSIDAAFGRHELQWLLSVGLPLGFSGQFFGNLEHTNYSDDDLEEILIVRSGDVEAGEDNNVVSVGLSRPIGRGFAADARYSWYRNESLLIGEYYRQRVLSLGLEWQAGTVSGF